MKQSNKEFNLAVIKDLQSELNNHSVYKTIQDQETLRIFMQHHIFSVWDFMSLVKYLQHFIAPAKSPWGIHASKNTRRFINSIVLEEESDIGLPDKEGMATYASHFEMYCEAMSEVGATCENAVKFSSAVQKYGFEASIELMYIPEPSRLFMRKTMSFIHTDKPHIVAAAFALGREKIIPDMFRKLLSSMNIERAQAPAFYYYLDRHIHLDEDFHAPLSLQMLNELCESNPTKLAEAEVAAKEAISARIKFWDGVEAAIHANRSVTVA